jgi:hypothetical protein
MLFRAGKTIRMLAAAGAAATPSFGVGPVGTAAAAVPVPTRSACGMSYDPLLYTASPSGPCTEFSIPFTSVTPLAGGGSQYTHTDANGTVTSIAIP